MYYSDEERKITQAFYRNLDRFEAEKMTLAWESGTITAHFDTCFDDFNDDNEDEEYTSFVFKVIDVSGEPPVFITKDNFFCVNYHNFPDAIMVEGKKIN